MKRSVTLFLLLMLLTACAQEPTPVITPTAPTSAQVTEAPTASPTAAPTEAPTQAPTEPKTLLALRQFDPDDTSYEGTEAETEQAAILLENLSLPETALKAYENEESLAPIAAALDAELGLALDESWKYYIHYYTQEQDVGILAMTYWIDGIIATNRAVTIPINNGTATTVIYSYLDQDLDESALLAKYRTFISTHEQQRENLLGEDFEIDAESTLYFYNFRTDQLKYTYNIFYRHIETGIIDNSYGTELIIE